MITNKEVKIKVSEPLTTKYIENELQKFNSDILSWAITDKNDEFYTLNIAMVKD